MFWIRLSHSIERSWYTFSVKDQTVNMLGFVRHLIFAMTTQKQPQTIHKRPRLCFTEPLFTKCRQKATVGPWAIVYLRLL